MRTAVLLESRRVPAWVALALRQADELDLIDLRLVITEAAGGNRAGPSGGWAFRAYEALDRRLSCARLDPDEAADPGAGLPGGRGMAPVVHDGGGDLVSALAKAQIDVVLDFCAHPDRHALANASRHGVWWVQLGDSRRGADGPPLFGEMQAREPTCAVELHRTRAGAPGGSRVISRSFAATDPGSLARNRAAAHRRAAYLIVRALRDLPRGDCDEPGAGWEAQPAATAVPLQPSATKVIRHLGRLARGAARRWIATRIFTGQWFVAIGKRAPGAAPLEHPERLQPLNPPRGRFYADPFLLEHEGRRCVFFEDCPLEGGKGLISCVELASDGTASAARKVLEREHHLSYPFTFTWKGEAYMVPETAAARTVELFRATRFPERWTRERVLLRDIRALDPTLVFHGDRFWLFAVVLVGGSEVWDELSLFSSEALDGDWTPHPMNPIVSDARRARPAGRIFEHDGALVRPGQDCTGRYGRAIVLNRIETIEVDDYRERPIGTIEPDWAPHIGGTHCYDRDLGYEVVDGCRRVLRWGRRGRDRQRPDGQ